MMSCWPTMKVETAVRILPNVSVKWATAGSSSVVVMFLKFKFQGSKFNEEIEQMYVVDDSKFEI